MNEWLIVAEITRTILMMSVTGSIVALLLFALKPIIRDRIPKNAQYYLWLVVITCLLVPFSRLITLPSPEPIAWIHETINEGIKPNHQWWDEISQERYQTSFESLDAPEQIDVMYKSGSAMRWELNKSLVGYPVIYPTIVFLIIVLQYVAFCIKLRLRREPPLPEDATMLNELSTNRKAPRLFRNRVASTPMLIGLFRPAIILPDCEYTKDQLRYVLLHELTHLRRGDMMIRWLTVIACSVHWFNPIVWLAKREIDRACELACDEAVINSLSDDDKQTYGDTLLFVASDGKGIPAALAMSENKRNLKERLRGIMLSKKRTRLAIAMSAVLITVVAVGGIAFGAGIRITKTFDLENITQIDVRSGTTGNIAQVTDIDKLHIMCEFFTDNEFIRVGSSGNSTGWRYRLTFYTDEVVTENIIVMSDTLINYDGYFWERETAFHSIDMFTYSLGEMPTVYIYVYDDGQGGERYVMFEDNGVHTRSEIMAADTVTIDEINSVFAQFTDRFDYDIRAMDHENFDMNRFDKIKFLLVLPDGVDYSGSITYFDAPNVEVIG